MPDVNQLQNLLPSSVAAQIPPDVRAKLLAGQLAQQQAAAPKAPYTSRTAGLLSALQGGVGGLMEGSAIKQAMDGQRQGNAAAMEFLRSYQQGQQGAGGSPAPSPAAAPLSPWGSAGGGSDAVASKSHTDFLNSIMPEAQRVSAQTGIDARLIAAQAAHESNFGKSAPGGNLFGIKGAGTGPISTMESVNGQMVPTKASFATYDSPSAAFDGYGKLMSGDRYAGVRNGQGLDAQLAALGKSGYATDPNYAAKVGAIARGIQGPGAASTGSTTAAADAPVPNAYPVASTSLPPGVTPDMIGNGTGAPSQSDGTVRGDLLAAAAQHGMQASDADMPAPNAIPTGATGLPPGVTPGMMNPKPAPQPGDAPFDPEGTGPANYDPSAAPLMGNPASALATAIQNYKPPLGQTQAASVPPPTTAGTPPGAPSPSILPPPRPPSGLGTAAAPVVPPPQAGDAAPMQTSDGTVRGDLIAAAQRHGLDVAMDPVVPDPVGAGMPADPASPNADLAGPQSDAAMGNDGAPLPSPNAALAAASSPPAPLPGADDPVGGLIGDGTGGPSLRDTIMSAMQGGGSPPATGPMSVPGADDPVGGMMGSPGASPTGSAAPAPPGGGPPPPVLATPGLPPPSQTMGVAPAPPLPASGTGPQPSSGAPSIAGTGAALPQTGPMPPPGAQSLAAAAPNANAPAPNASPAGPAPMASPLAAALSGPQPLGLPGDGGGDPSSPQNFLRQEMLARQLGGGQAQTAATPSAAAPGPTPGSFMAGIMGAGQPPAAPGASQGAPGSGMLGMGGAPMAPPSAQPSATSGPQGAYQQGTPAQARAIAAQTQANPGANPASQAIAGQVMAATGSPGGGTPYRSSVGGALGGQNGFGGQVSPEVYAQGVAVMDNPYASSEMKNLVVQRLFPQMQTKEMPDGTFLGFNPNTMETHVLYQGQTKHFDATKTGLIYDQFNGQASNGAGGVGGNGFRPATPAERTQYGVGDDRPMYFGPGGQPEFGQPGTAGQGETAEAKTAGEGAAARRGDMLSGADAAPEKIARLNLLGSVLDKTQTGPLAPELGNAAAIAQRLGVSNDRLQALGIDPNSPVNNQIANKLAGEMTMSSIGAKNGGMPASNFSVAERQFIEALYPSIQNQPGSNRAVTDVLTAVEQRKLQTADAWAGYKDQQRQTGKPLSYEDFEDSFRRAHAQDNIFAPVIQKYQSGAYTTAPPTAGGLPASAPSQAGPAAAAPQGGPPQPQDQGGGYLPGAARGAAAQGQGGPAGGAPPQNGPQGQAPPSSAIAQAQAAISRGAPRAAVMQRLQSMGINPAGL